MLTEDAKKLKKKPKKKMTKEQRERMLRDKKRVKPDNK